MPAPSRSDVRRVRIEQIKIRRARPSDKKIVLAFCRRTWGDWGDYIDKVWDEWVADRKGYFAIASIDGRPVGTGKLTVLNSREVWFEGLRVDRALRGKGIAHLLTAFLAREALKRRAETIRYATGEVNRASLHIGKSWGMRVVGRYSILYSAADGRRSTIFARVSSMHPRGEALDELLKLVCWAPFTKAMSGLASKGWTFFKVDRNFLETAFKKREIFLGMRPGESTPLGILIASPEHDKGRLLIKLVAESNERALGELLSGARRLAHDLKLRRMRLVVPATRSILAAARAAGFKQEDKGFYHVVLEADLESAKTRNRVARQVNRYR